MKIQTVFLALVSFIFCLATAQATPRSPYKVTVKGSIESFLKGDTKTLHLSFRTPDGKEIIRLKRRKKFSPQFIKNGVTVEDKIANSLVLLQGSRKTRNSRWTQLKGVGADLLRGVLRLRFFSRRGRGYELILDTDESFDESTSPARLAHIPRNMTPPLCGLSSEETALSHQHEAPTASAHVRTTRASTQEIDISTDADAEYYLLHGADTNSRIQTILNDVEALYSDQLSLVFNIKKQNSYTDIGTQPYKQTDASSLLSEFRTHLLTSSHLGNYDLAHLWTGKDLDGNTAGVAYKGVLCRSASYNVGLSSELNSSLFNFITTGHEIGHNLDASHDYGDPSSGPNDPSYQGYIMNAVASSANKTFSSYSIAEVNTHISNYPSCLSSGTGGGSGGDGGGTEDPGDGGGKSGSLDLSLEITAKGKSGKKLKYTATATLNSTGVTEPCQVKLYGANKENQLINATDLATAEKVYLIATRSISPGEPVALSTKVNNGSASSKKTHYNQAEVICADESSGLSTRISMKAYSKAKKTFNRLASALTE